MNRTAMKTLADWKNRPHRKPMIIKGARQTGKTWLMKHFGETEFESCAYINFDHNARMKALFSGDYNADRIIEGLSIESGVMINPDKTLIILDEIQEVPEALHMLKYFDEDERHDYYIVAAGSLLGIALHEGTSFPVGKTEMMNLYPLTFTEFLDATGNSALNRLLDRADFEMITAFKDKYIDLLRLYFFIGGMPAAVNEYVSSGNLSEVRRIQENLTDSYRQDFSKHAASALIPRLNLVWDGIPSQLAKENRKFVYSALRPGARAKDFDLAITWLNDCGMIYKVQRVSKGGMPLKAYADFDSFKLYMSDVGLLGAMSGLDAKSILSGNDIFTEFKGALTEQYVCQQLISECGYTPYYWSSDSSAGEVDFVIQKDGNVLPVEVKASENLKAKSIKLFVEKNGLPFGLRTSMSDYRREEKLINLPLYALSALNKI